MAKPDALASKVILITGASSGIGEAVAEEASRRGARVVLLARRLDRLQATASAIEARGGEALAVACDVSRDGDLEAATARALERFGALDVVVANAGFGVTGRIADLTLDDYRRQLETNVFGVVRTAQATLAALTSRRGCLAIVGSVSSYLAAPGTAAYAMSKFAVRAFAEAADAEWRERGVAVVLLVPGFVDSAIRNVDNAGQPTGGADPAPAWLRMPRDRAARQILDAIAARRREQVITGHGQAAVFLQRHSPWLLRRLLALGSRWGEKTFPSTGPGAPGDPQDPTSPR